jgi:hypothetical protein
MSSTQFGLEAFVLGMPAVGMLVAAFFRLDGLLARSNDNSGIGYPLSHRGEDGDFVCIEPDGRYSVGVVEGTGRGLAQRSAGHIPRRGGPGAVRRVSVEWVKEGSKE